jgi:hypothetical protein
MGPEAFPPHMQTNHSPANTKEDSRNIPENVPQLPYIFKYPASNFGSAGKFFDKLSQQ